MQLTLILPVASKAEPSSDDDVDRIELAETEVRFSIYKYYVF